MRMYDLIMKKRNGSSLDKEEIEFLIREYVNGNIPDYQMSAFLMAVYFKGMTKEETVEMTLAAAHSGDMVDLSAIEGVKVDKHSTGGVGDKTTLIVAPIAAACGVKVAKMSGRGLGHTGGTVDKLESIPGMRICLTQEEFIDVVKKTGISIVGQSGNLAPADKKMYALRDVTATVDSIPLIAVSIMSKKLAAGNDCILLDVKTGSGAFMKTVEDANRLAEEMVMIGENAGKKTVALITNMDVPLGHNIGNSLEVVEAVKTLKGEGPKDLTEVCVELAANMLYLAGDKDMEECRRRVLEVIDDGSALDKLAEMVEAQGGDPEYIYHPEKFKKAAYEKVIYADRSGYILSMDTQGCGIATSLLGAGRETKESSIDYAAGMILKKKTGDYVEANEPLAIMYAEEESRFEQAQIRFQESLQFGEQPPEPIKLIYSRVTKTDRK